MTNYPFLYKNCIDDEILKKILDFSMENSNKFQLNKASAYRKFWMFSKDENIQFLYDLKLKLANHFGLKDWVMDPYFYDFIGHIEEGGNVHLHKDPVIEGREHIRINLIISKPNSGCLPKIDSIELEGINEGDCWLNFASLTHHGTTPVIGDKPRMGVSFGYQVDKNETLKLFLKYKYWLQEELKKKINGNSNN